MVLELQGAGAALVVLLAGLLFVNIRDESRRKLDFDFRLVSVIVMFGCLGLAATLVLLAGPSAWSNQDYWASGLIVGVLGLLGLLALFEYSRLALDRRDFLGMYLQVFAAVLISLVIAIFQVLAKDGNA